MNCIMKRIATAFVLGLTLMLWAPAVQAAPGWFIAEIVAAGPSDSGIMFMKLNDTADTQEFKGKWFRASDSVSREMLATLLAAFTADKLIWIRADLDASVPIVTRMYIRE